MSHRLEPHRSAGPTRDTDPKTYDARKFNCLFFFLNRFLFEVSSVYLTVKKYVYFLQSSKIFRILLFSPLYDNTLRSNLNTKCHYKYYRICSNLHLLVFFLCAYIYTNNGMSANLYNIPYLYPIYLKHVL